MNFINSSHRSRWLFTSEHLEHIRAKNNAASTAKVDGLRDSTSAEASIQKFKPLTVDEEKHLLRYYLGQIAHICGLLRLPKKVQASAQIYLKRFYLAHSCMDHDPCYTAWTCVYIACKIEEHYISAEELTKQLNQPAEAVLGCELKVLQALQFDLIVHNPYRSLNGLFHDINSLRQSAPQLLDSDLVTCSTSTMERAMAEAVNTVDALMRMEVPLLFTPGQLAAQCLKVGFKKCGVRVDDYLRRVAHESHERLKEAGCAPEMSAESSFQQLMSACLDIDRLARSEPAALKQEEVAQIDRKLKTWINLMAKAARKAEKGTKEEREARRAAKVSKRREEQLAKQEALLGPMADIRRTN